MVNRCGMFIIIVVCFIASSCRTGREIHRSLEEEKKGKEVTLESLKNNKNFEKYLKLDGASVTMRINSKEERFSAGIAIKRDELLIISIIPMAGIEAMRVYCTKDSIIVLNRKEKTYYCETYGKILSRYGVHINFDDLVAICANEFFIYEKENENIYNVRYENVDNERRRAEYTNSTEKESKIQQSIIYNTIKGTIEEILIVDDRKNMKMTVNYSNFIKVEEGVFPEKMAIMIKRGKNTLTMRIDIRKIEAEKEINLNIEIPAQYIKTEL